MPDRICVQTDQYSRIASLLQDLSQELDTCAAQLGRINISHDAGADLRVQLGSRLSATGLTLPTGDLSDCLQRIQRILRSTGSYCTTLSDRVNHVSALFEQLEHELAGKFTQTGSPAPFTPGSSGAVSLGDLGYVFPPIAIDPNAIRFPTDGAIPIWSQVSGDFTLSPMARGWTLSIGTQSIASFFTDKDGFSTTSLHLESKGKIKDSIDTPEKNLSDTKSDQLIGNVRLDKVTDPFKGRISVLTGADSVAYTNSIFNAQIHKETENASGDLTFSAGKIDANSGYTFGLYRNKDGTFSLGADAKVGISATAFEAELSTQYEIIDGVSVSTDVTATAGQVSVGGEVKAGMTDDGFAAYGKAEFEAIGGEISAEMGVDVAGLKGTVGASLNYGFGAHLEAGFQDGKLTVDIGASLGVGGSLSFDLDVGNFFDNVATGAKKIGKTIFSIFA